MKRRTFLKSALVLPLFANLFTSCAMEDNSLSILIPLYSYPNWWDKENYSWQKVIDIKNRYKDVKIIAIINPDNGHFNKANSDFEKGIKDLANANIEMVGYIYTKYGKRDFNELKADILSWKKYYQNLGIEGIFFDEASTDKNLLNYYSKISKEARNNGFKKVILNPGITTDKAYIESSIADIIVSYENRHQELLSNPPSKYNTPTQNTKLAMLIYEMIDDSVKDLEDFAREHKFNYIYFTEDGADGNPWDSVSKFLEKEVKLTQSS